MILGYKRNVREVNIQKNYTRSKIMKIIVICWLICQCIQSILSFCGHSHMCLSQFLRNAGHHRVLQYVIEVNPIRNVTNMQCSLCLHQKLPSSVYVNSDQLTELRRHKQLFACSLENIDVEKPMHLSPEINVYLYIPLNDSKIIMDLPFHLRYQSAKFDGRYEKISLSKPSLLTMCNISTGKESNEPLSEAPCSACSTITCNWSLHSYDFVTGPVELLMPIGNLNHYPFVVIITLLVTCSGCVYILSSLALSQSKENMITSKKKK